MKRATIRLILAAPISGLALIAMLSGCGQAPGGTGGGSTNVLKAAGMSEFDYLACDGGPHMVVPKELSAQWKAVKSISDVTNPKTDYGRACAATVSQRMRWFR